MEKYTMTSTKMRPLCCSCSSQFFLRANYKKIDGCIPHTLQCGHSACETCIINNYTRKSGKILTCTICAAKCELTYEEIQFLRKNDFKMMFPINLQILGTLFYNLIEGPLLAQPLRTLSIEKLRESVKFKPIVEKIPTNEVKCSRCTDVSEYKCIQCVSPLCNSCFTKHQSYFDSKDHVKIKIGEEKFLIGSKKCEKHPENIADLYCNDCVKNICVNCVITMGNPCRSHEVIPAKDKNLNLEVDLIKIKPKLHQILHEIKKSRNRIENDLKDRKNALHFRNSTNKIVQTYGKLHAAIQAQTFSLVETLEKFESGTNESKETLDLLIKNEKEVGEIINAIDMVFNPLLKKEINSYLISKTAKESLDIPYILTVPNSDIPEPEIIINDEILNHVKNYCKLKDIFVDSYKITSSPKFSSESESLSPPIIYNMGSPTKHYNYKNDFELHKSSTNSSISENGDEEKKLTIGSKEKVFVSHINNPHDFYVRRLSKVTILDEMTNYFNSSNPVCSVSEESIQPGKMFITMDIKQTYWCRVIVMSVMIRKEVDGNLESVVMSKFIDNGYVKEVPVKSLAIIEPKYSLIPPLSIHCSLVPCQIASGNWTQNDNMFMLKMIQSVKWCNMEVIKINDDTFEVDLTMSSNRTDDGNFSVMDAFIFHKRATQMLQENQVNKMTTNLKTKIPYVNKQSIQNTDEVIITDVVTPALFYVRKVKFEGTFQRLYDDLNAQYNIQDETRSIFIPKGGMIVACYVEDIGWCRGRVEDVQCPQRIKVYLLDYGGRVTVQWNTLRKLHPNMCKLIFGAVKCTLHGIKPFNDKWCEDSITLLTKCKEGTVMVVDRNWKTNTFKIILNSNIDGEIVSVNDVMVKSGYAVTIEINENLIPKILSKPENMITQPKSVDVTSSASQEVDDNIYVKILSANNPSTIYLTLLSDEDELYNLYDGLQEHYKDSLPNPELEWAVHDICAVYSSKFSIWQRGAITNIDKDSVVVTLKDIGIVETVTISKLRILADKFFSVRNGSLKCHLTGILPAAGKNWPNITCEYLLELVTKFEKFYIVKDGQVLDKSLPVKLWVYHKTEGGALEPMIQEWRCINDMIVEQGLAIRDNDSAESIPLELEDKNVLNITIPEIVPVPVEYKIIANWLPAPVPTKAQFKGNPTFVDDDMGIYIYDSNLPTSQLERITSVLCEMFENSTPQANDIFWYVGQPCIVQYQPDLKYHRGQVLAIEDSNNVLVEYVDFGNTAICPISTLRKNVIFTDVPVQVFKYKIAGVEPLTETWDQEILDFVQLYIVEKSCNIRLLGIAEDGSVYIKMKINGYISLCDLLIEKGYAKYANYPKLTPFKEVVQPEDETDINDSDIVFDNDICA